MTDKKNCEHLNTRIIEKQETFAYKGEDIEVVSSIKVCTDCGKELNDPELTNETLKSIYATYREKNTMKHWEQVKGNYFTCGGDALWYCPACKSKESWHVYGVEHSENHSHKCPVCGTTLLYPWETSDENL